MVQVLPAVFFLEAVYLQSVGGWWWYVRYRASLQQATAYCQQTQHVGGLQSCRDKSEGDHTWLNLTTQNAVFSIWTKSLNCCSYEPDVCDPKLKVTHHVAVTQVPLIKTPLHVINMWKHQLHSSRLPYTSSYLHLHTKIAAVAELCDVN